MGLLSAFGFGEKTTRPRRVLFYTKYGTVSFRRGAEQYGLVHIKGFGGGVIMRDSTTPMYLGQAVWPTRTPEGARRQQRRSQVITLREGDPHPFVPAAGFKNRYRGSLALLQDKTGISDDVTAFAIADHARMGSLHEAQTRQLMLVLIIAIFGFVLAGLATPILKIFGI